MVEALLSLYSVIRLSGTQPVCPVRVASLLVKWNSHFMPIRTLSPYVYVPAPI